MKHRTSIHFTLVEQIARYMDRISSSRIMLFALRQNSSLYVFSKSDKL